MQPIVQWLEGLGLGQYGLTFVQADIDLAVLPDLTEADLEKLGVTLGHRKKLLRAIAALSGDQASRPEVPSPAPESPALSGAERRQVTVMFSDLVGSTELASRLDPEDLREVIGRYHARVAETVRRFDGFVAKYMGDGVLIYFGYPEAHEDDAEQGVRAGLALVDAVGELPVPDRLQVRIGIATGLVVVGDLIGEGESRERGIIGETPNLASRLQALADPGAVVISENTRRQIGELFEIRDLGPQSLKGYAHEQRAWHVVAENRALGRFEALRGVAVAPLVGREEELELLLRRWEQAKSGNGKVVLISGEPGIGKSRLAEALAERVASQPHIRIRYFCSPHHQDSALYPQIAQLERAAGFTRDDTDETRLAKLKSVLAQSDASDEAVALIADLLSIPTDQRARIQQMTPQLRRDKTFATLTEQLIGPTSHQPVLMIYEDIHWIDPSSRELLDRAIERLEQSPVLLLTTFRPEFQPSWAGQPNVTSIALTRLDHRYTIAMISEIAGEELPAEVTEEIAERTDGVPLFVEEVTKAAIESGAQATEALSLLPHPALAVPPTLHAWLVARLDRLGAAARNLTQKGAVIGREFHYRLIAAIADRPEPELRETLEQLTSAGLLFARGAPPEATYLFKHALVQDAAYGTLLKNRRRVLHGMLAEALEQRFPEIAETQPELLAYHYTEAKQIEKAISLWRNAGSLALKRMALTEAITHLNKGMKLVVSLPASAERDSEELGLRSLLGPAWIAHKGWQVPEVWDSLHPALALAHSLGRNNALLPIFWGLCLNVVSSGRATESLDWVMHMQESAQTCDDPALLISAHLCALFSYFHLGELIEARQHAGQALALYNEERHRYLVNILNHDPKTFSLVFLARLPWMLGYPEQAMKIIDSMDVHARRLGHPFDLSFALTVGARVFDDCGKPDEPLKRAAEAERIGRENSLRVVTEMLAPRTSGMALIRKGQFAAGTGILAGSLATSEATGLRISVPYMKSVLAEGIAELGDIDGALDLVEQVIVQVERPGWEERYYFAETLRLKGWLLSLRGNLEGAENNYLASLEWARHQGAKSWELRTAIGYAHLMRDQGRISEAYALLAPVYGWFTEGFGTKDLIEAKALLDELGAGRR